jgi:hypothetical protein
MHRIEQSLISNRPKLRLAEIERLIKKYRLIVPPPSRQALHKLCQDGTLETSTTSPTSFGWMVYEDSFLEWIKSLDGEGDGLA